MTRTGSQARAWALSQHSFPVGYCLIFVHDAFGVGAKYGTATLGWTYAAHKHRQSHGAGIPSSVPIWWTGGSHGYGHVAFSLGNGLCRSTDWPYSGSVSTARIDDITARWGLHFQGWTEDINGVRVYTGSPGVSSGFLIDASAVAHAAKTGGTIPNGAKLKKAVTAEVGRGGMNLQTPTLGGPFKTQYKLVQHKYLGSIGAVSHPGDIDGIPGPSSLRWLGSRHGFAVQG